MATDLLSKSNGVHFEAEQSSLRCQQTAWMLTGGRSINADIVTTAMQAKRMTNVSFVVPGFLHAISGLSERRGFTSEEGADNIDMVLEWLRRQRLGDLPGIVTIFEMHCAVTPVVG